MRDRLRNGRTGNVRARSRSAGGGDVAAAPGASRLQGGIVPSGHCAPADLTTSAASSAPTTAAWRLGDITMRRTSRGRADPARRVVVQYRVWPRAAKLGEGATVAQW